MSAFKSGRKARSTDDVEAAIAASTATPTKTVRMTPKQVRGLVCRMLRLVGERPMARRDVFEAVTRGEDDYTSAQLTGAWQSLIDSGKVASTGGPARRGGMRSPDTIRRVGDCIARGRECP